MAANAGVNKEEAKVLKSLADGDSPMANKTIAAATGLDSKVVSSTVKKLKERGLVDSPARCKYGITPAGEKELG